MLFATTHTIPQPYEALGIVSSTFEIDRGLLARQNVTKSFSQANKELEGQAKKLGGNAVIGICSTSITCGHDSIILVTGTAIRIK
ncbi:MAG: heavy metal-binding domain-containing protein [Ktedonobacterales bacterium]